MRSQWGTNALMSSNLAPWE